MNVYDWVSECPDRGLPKLHIDVERAIDIEIVAVEVTAHDAFIMVRWMECTIYDLHIW